MNAKIQFRNFLIIFTLVVSSACKSDKQVEEPNVITEPDTTVIAPASEQSEKSYQNERFRNVTVERVDDSTFQIQGEAQIFEASFGWYIEDGHNMLDEGHEMTDAGAPEWGKFNFSITAQKDRTNSTLHLVLFETSARDGSKQYTLPVPLK